MHVFVFFFTPDLAKLKKTSSGSVRKNTKSAINKVIMGHVCVLDEAAGIGLLSCEGKCTVTSCKSCLWRRSTAPKVNIFVQFGFVPVSLVGA